MRFARVGVRDVPLKLRFGFIVRVEEPNQFGKPQVETLAIIQRDSDDCCSEPKPRIGLGSQRQLESLEFEQKRRSHVRGIATERKR